MTTLRKLSDPAPQHLEAIKRLRQEAEEVKTFSNQLKLPESALELEKEEPDMVEDQDTNLNDESNFDDELDALQAELEKHRAEQQPQRQERMSPEEQLRNEILSTFNSREDRPSQEQINAWKDKFGSQGVQLLALDEQNVYVYTHITVKQWEKIQAIVQQAAGTALQAQAERTLREKVIRSAVLWPRLESNFFEDCRAGLPDTLYELILIHSYFLSPAQAMTLTTQL